MLIFATKTLKKIIFVS